MNGNANELALAHIRKESEEIFIKLFENKQIRYRPTAGNLIFGCGSNKVLGCKIPIYTKNANTIKNDLLSSFIPKSLLNFRNATNTKIIAIIEIICSMPKTWKVYGFIFVLIINYE